HLKTCATKDGIARVITPRLIAKAVPVAIDFDDQPTFEAREVGRDQTNRKLPAKFQAVRPRTQDSPEQNLGQAQFAAQASGALYLLDWCLEDRWAPSTMLRMVPLPGSGRI